MISQSNSFNYCYNTILFILFISFNNGIKLKVSFDFMELLMKCRSAAHNQPNQLINSTNQLNQLLIQHWLLIVDWCWLLIACCCARFIHKSINFINFFVHSALFRLHSNLFSFHSISFHFAQPSINTNQLTNQIKLFNLMELMCCFRRVLPLLCWIRQLIQTRKGAAKAVNSLSFNWIAH